MWPRAAHPWPSDSNRRNEPELYEQNLHFPTCSFFAPWDPRVWSILGRHYRLHWLSIYNLLSHTAIVKPNCPVYFKMHQWHTGCITLTCQAALPWRSYYPKPTDSPYVSYLQLDPSCSKVVLSAAYHYLRFHHSSAYECTSAKNFRRRHGRKHMLSTTS
jgi:hypothetical protein